LKFHVDCTFATVKKPLPVLEDPNTSFLDIASQPAQRRINCQYFPYTTVLLMSGGMEGV
jgi:hypothetical protein